MFKFLTPDFPYINFGLLVENLHEIMYVFMLTALFYIPGLIYALSSINEDTNIDDLIKKYHENNN